MNEWAHPVVIAILLVHLGFRIWWRRQQRREWRRQEEARRRFSEDLQRTRKAMDEVREALAPK